MNNCVKHPVMNTQILDTKSKFDKPLHFIGSVIREKNVKYFHLAANRVVFQDTIQKSVEKFSKT